MIFIKQNKLIIFLALLLLGILFPFILAVHEFSTTGGWPVWAGFSECTLIDGTVRPAKTYWDVLELAIVPLSIAIVAYFFSRSERRAKEQIEEARYITEKNLRLEQLRDTILQNYLTYMTDLLLNSQLQESTTSAVVRDIARIRTMVALSEIGSPRNGLILQFLFGAKLLTVGSSVVNLNGCNLRGVNLIGGRYYGVNLAGANLENGLFFRTDLRHASLKKAYLKDAKFTRADLQGADLSGAILLNADLSFCRLEGVDLSLANLQGANLSQCNLEGTNLSYANLQEATINDKQLEVASSLTGATLPDGTIYQASG